MIEVIQDEGGKVIAYATWYRTTKYLEYSAEFTDEELCVAVIDCFWKHESCGLSVKECIEYMVFQCLNKNPKLMYAHFNRHHEGRQSSKFHWYTKEQMMKVSGKHG